MKKLLKVLFFGALIAAAAQLIQAKKAEWENLTEEEVRTKLDTKLGTRVPEDKLAMIQDKVVDKLRTSGRLREDAGAPAGEQSVEAS